MSKKLVIFDFDGVIVESLDLWFRITQINNPGLTKEEYYSMSHGNYIEAFESKKLIYTEEGLEEYRSNLLLIDSPKEIVSFIENNSNKFLYAIVSSGNEITIKRFLEKENLVNYFTDILGNQTHKNKTTKISNLLEKYCLENKNAVFITDTLGDILEANETGIKSVGVLWGLHDRETLEKGNPEIIIDNPGELEEAINSILS